MQRTESASRAGLLRNRSLAAAAHRFWTARSLVGAAAGIVAALFSAGVEKVQHFLLETLTGYSTLRAARERRDPHPLPGDDRPD